MDNLKLFKELVNFKYKRNAIQAFEFYIAHVTICILLIAALTIFIPIITGIHTQTFIWKLIGILLALCNIYCIVLSLAILIVKKLYTSPLAIVLFLLTIIGAGLMSCLLGCVFPAILSTFEAKK